MTCAVFIEQHNSKATLFYVCSLLLAIKLVCFIVENIILHLFVENPID
jgi:hypothetical protein